MTANDVPTGRKGRYKCPFCEKVLHTEEAMIAHRNDGECAEKRNALRVGALA